MRDQKHNEEPLKCVAKANWGQARRPWCPRGERAGFTLLEVMVAAVVLAVGVASVSGAMVSAIALNNVNRETSLAQQAARMMIETVRATNFGDTFETFNLSPFDDPLGPASAAGQNFAVAGLSPQPGDADNMAGQIVFPTVVAGAVDFLREDVVDADLGMPRDLNADGLIDALNHANDYQILPVRVRVAWRGFSGNRALELESVLVER